MAKIIGFKKDQKKYKATCKICGAIIVFDESEIQNTYQRDEYRFSYGTCPNCECIVSFDKYDSEYKKK